MGQHNPGLLEQEKGLRLRAPMTIVASGRQIEMLRASDKAHLLDEANLLPVELHADITREHLSGAGIVVMQIDPAVPSSMRRIEQARALRPDLPLIVALESADISLVRTLLREGVADVVALPFAPEELLQAAISAFETRSPASEAAVRLAPFVAVTRALGGTGGTSLVTHLAAEFAQGGARTCLLDLDLQFGRVAEVLGIKARRNINDLLEAGGRIDDAFLQSVVASHSSGLDVVSAPEEILPLEAVDSDKLRKVMETVRQNYDFVFADMPSNLTNWSLSTLAEADRIVMVVEQNLSSLRQAKRRLELFRQVGMDSGSVAIVVNRVERRLFGSISLSDVEDALGRKVLLGLHADEQNLGVAQDQGLLVGQVRAKSSYSADIRKLARDLKDQLERESVA